MFSEPPIQFFCAVCGQALIADARFGGSVIACPDCHRTVPVPGTIVHADQEESKCPPAFSPEILSVEITFLCPGCSGSLITDARSGGDPFVCPTCETTGEVPTWSRAGVRPPDAVAGKISTGRSLSPEEIAFLSAPSPENSDALSG